MSQQEAAAIVAKLALSACTDSSTLLACCDALTLILPTQDLLKSAATCATAARDADTARMALDAAIEAALPGGQFRLPLSTK